MKVKSKCIEIRHLKREEQLRSYDCDISVHIDAIEIFIPELKRTIAIKIKDAREVLDSDVKEQITEKTIEKGCNTCLHFDSWEGECKKHIAKQWESRDCDTSKCSEYKLDPLYTNMD